MLRTTYQEPVRADDLSDTQAELLLDEQKTMPEYKALVANLAKAHQLSDAEARHAMDVALLALNRRALPAKFNQHTVVKEI